MSLVEIGLSFLEGMALIVSPCILPVLPLVLAASVDGGRRRPYGIIIGFVLSFSLFVLLSRKLVLALGIDLDIIKYGSLVLLFMLGLVLLSSTLSGKFSALSHGAANLGNQIASTKNEGLLGGIVIGALIGLVWTPCAGPLLAAVLVQVIRQQTDLAGYFLILSFSIGATIPMLIIALTGRKLMNKLGFLMRHAVAIRKAFGVLIMLSVVYIGTGADATTWLPGEQASPANKEEATSLRDGLKQIYPAPQMAGIEAWLNSPPLVLQELEGKVVLIDFWAYSCINCVRTLPYLTDWDKKYRDQGLVIIGVHSPEFEFEKKLENVRAALAQHGIRHPVALDNSLSTWLNFKNRYWPAHYLINKEGQVVYTHFGEGKYDITENNIRFLLGLRDKAETIKVEAPTFGADQTPEIYLGYGRAKNFGSKESMAHDAELKYRFPSFLPANSWAFSGKWKAEAERSIALEKGAALRLNFKARKVFLVLGSASGKPIHATLSLNGEALAGYAGKDATAGVVTIKRNTLYELIDQKIPKNSLLEIKTDAPGLEVYAFTFG